MFFQGIHHPFSLYAKTNENFSQSAALKIASVPCSEVCKAIQQ